MLWTTEPSTFKTRNFKVIDCYFYHHPDAEIIVYASHLDHHYFQSYQSAGYNISVVRLNDTFLFDLSKHCPGKKWIGSLEKWKKGRYYYSHITDYVRFCALYRWGGLYSDFDAIAIQRLDFHKSFIGRDSAQSNGSCTWCTWKQDIYLPPGVMATSKGHSLTKTALEIGFEDDYDPNIFNSVGPMAVTKAYNSLIRSGRMDSIEIFKQHELYPYNYLNSKILLAKISDPRGKLDRLRKSSLSLHLYGHQTSKLSIHPESILFAAFDLFSVIKPQDTIKIVGPTHLAVGQLLEELPDTRIVAPANIDWQTTFNVEIKTIYGKMRIATSGRKSKEIAENGWTNSIALAENSIAAINRKLSRIIYYSLNLRNGRDQISITLSFTDKDKSSKIQTFKIPVYDIASLVTIIVKTVGRMDKVIALAESTRKYYKTVKIIVSDDHEQLSRSEGMSREFYYLPLEPDVGLSAGRNRMVERVETEYFLTLDDDFTMDGTSQIGLLLHALETPPVDGSRRFDIAGGKNPVDEGKFNLDFCGFFTIANKTLFLHPGNYGNHELCQHVDFVPNIFLGRTSTFKNVIQWDEVLKVGEHEDFFIRAKALGLKTLTCPSVTFIHGLIRV